MRYEKPVACEFRRNYGKKIRQVLHTCLIKANYQYFEYKEEIKEAQTLTTSHLEGNQNRRSADSDFFSFQKFESVFRSLTELSGF
jgi:hypothetical protein